MFLAFVILVLVLKIQEIKGLKRHQSPELIAENRKTNAHSFRFSLSIFYVFLLMGFLDLLLLIILGTTFSFNFGAMNPETEDAAVYFAKYVVEHMGIGKAAILMLVAPIALLFSYTKTHKNPKMDKFIPLAGVALILFIYLEGLFQIVTINVSIIVQKVADYLSQIMGGTE